MASEPTAPLSDQATVDRAKKFTPYEHVVGEDGRIGLVMRDEPKTLPHEVVVWYDTDDIRTVWVDALRLASDGELRELARTTPSESGHGWCLDLMHPYFPGVSCLRCGRFVGRDGYIGVEHFEMSETIASVEGECRRCLERESAAFGKSLRSEESA